MLCVLCSRCNVVVGMGEGSGYSEGVSVDYVGEMGVVVWVLWCRCGKWVLWCRCVKWVLWCM